MCTCGHPHEPPCGLRSCSRQPAESGSFGRQKFELAFARNAGRGRRAATPLPPPVKRIAKGRHPVISVARRDLADEWHPEKNDKGVDEVTLGSDYRAWWVCKKDESHPAWQERVEKRALKKRGGCPECSKGQ